MATITSVTHEQVKMVVRLHTTAGRKKEHAFLVEGPVFIESFASHGYRLIALYCTRQAYEKNSISVGYVHFVTSAVMNKMSQATTPSGFLAIFQKPDRSDFSQLSSGLVLAQVSDPGNVGTLIRSAAAFGYTSVVMVEGCDPFSYKVIQATAGTLPLVNLFICSWQELRDAAKQQGVKLVALVTNGGKAPENFDSKTSLFVVGNEARGIPQEWQKSCDVECSLSMNRTVESLNAAVAGSLVLLLARREIQ